MRAQLQATTIQPRAVCRLAAWLVLSGIATVAAAASFEVQILKPLPGRNATGDVEVKIRVVSDKPVEQVRLLVNGEIERILESEPYETVVSLGYENREHLFEVEGRDIEGRVARAHLTTPSIRVDLEVSVELVQLFATVTKDNTPQLDLTRDSFRVLDDKKPQNIVTFERGDVRLTAAVLIDASFSMRGDRLATALAGARDFVSRMRPQDLLETKIFSDQLLYSTPFTANPEQIPVDAETLGAISAVADGTALNDYLYLALKELDVWPGRKVIILFSDGVDVESVLEIEDVMWKADRVQPIVYWIRADTERVDSLRYYTMWRDPDRHRANIDGLVELVDNSGGRIFEITEIGETPQIFADILEELRNQYVIGFYPSVDVDDGRWHDVDLQVSGHRVRTSRGYYDE